MEEEEFYLNLGLFLCSLAEQIEVYFNKLLWLFNESLGKNYNIFINEYCVVYFKKFVFDFVNVYIFLFGLVYESGFNFKMVFNIYFKKVISMMFWVFLKSVDFGLGI